jgi:hypothetical protein
MIRLQAIANVRRPTIATVISSSRHQCTVPLTPFIAVSAAM